MKDRDWIEEFSKEHLNVLVQKLEEEKRQVQNKKNIGANTAKKHN
jgi:hypothetical protein